MMVQITIYERLTDSITENACMNVDRPSSTFRAVLVDGEGL